ncbi:MAG: UDP-N-acetylmuramate:L-alanyl-gamma-D-glutamyl-meso-diaminopimelate ligase [Polyangiaceae bacterium]|nr:UDP-N-acetylmuramate:L-alanyl-gamma-D-glutamyl-meso-diaminopimelate ligase [Polyangiaceae bacterium]
MRIHFVAVAGTGMGPLAGLLRSAGHDVSGSDTSFYPPIGPALEAWGIHLMQGFDAGHLDPAPDLVVVGNVCRPTNVEARAAIDRGIRYASMAHTLAELVLEGRSPLVVGGTHGKTTTSAMCAHILSSAGLEPGFLIGGLPKNFDSSFRMPGHRKLALVSGSPTSHRRVPFVVEGDEYDTAFFEKTPKFWHYKPEVGVITSIEHDHIDIYPDEAAYRAAFDGFVERIPEKGLLVAAAHSGAVVDVASRAKADVAYFCLSDDDVGSVPPHWMGATVAASAAEGRTEFDLFVGGSLAGRLGMRVPGQHNVRNALAALAACCQGFGVPLKTATAALETFEGVRRRQDLLYVADGVRAYDDFAHHPTAVKETLAALRARHPDGALWAVFEPRSATACRALHQAEYAESFGDASRVIFAPLGRSDIPEAERLDLPRLVSELQRRGVDALAAPTIESIVETIVREARAGDTIALLSNGAFGGIYDKLKRALEERAIVG